MKLANGAWLLPFALAGMLALAPSLQAQPTSPVEKSRALEFPPTEENFEKGWRERVAVEFELVNDADVKSLRAALSDKVPYIRALAARALGVRDDKASAPKIAELAVNDPEHIVRIRAVEALGLLKLETEAIQAATKDSHGGVSWSAKISASQATNKTDFAALARAYGMPGWRVEATSAFSPAFAEAMAHDGPALIHLVLDERDISPFAAEQSV